MFDSDGLRDDAGGGRQAQHSTSQRVILDDLLHKRDAAGLLIQALLAN